MCRGFVVADDTSNGRLATGLAESLSGRFGRRKTVTKRVRARHPCRVVLFSRELTTLVRPSPGALSCFTRMPSASASSKFPVSLTSHHEFARGKPSWILSSQLSGKLTNSPLSATGVRKVVFWRACLAERALIVGLARRSASSRCLEILTAYLRWSFLGQGPLDLCRASPWYQRAGGF